jgi:hypothetical protein
LAEAITLGSGLDQVTLGASTYGNVDTVTGLNLVVTAGAIDYLKGDELVVTGLDLLAAGKFTTAQADLDLALKDASVYMAAGADVNTVAFQLGGNTYIYQDNVNDQLNQLDQADFVVKLTGLVDLDALVLAV